MSLKNENRLLLLLALLAAVAAVLLFLGPADLLGDAANTEVFLKLLLYPAVLGLIVLLWKKLDRRINNAKPGEKE